MKNVENWEIGQLFKSLRSDDEAWVIDSIDPVSELKLDSKGKPKVRSYSYVLLPIPEELSLTMPTGQQWVRKRHRFTSSDELIKKEIGLGNWKSLQ